MRFQLPDGQPSGLAALVRKLILENSAVGPDNIEAMLKLGQPFISSIASYGPYRKEHLSS